MKNLTSSTFARYSLLVLLLFSVACTQGSPPKKGDEANGQTAAPHNPAKEPKGAKDPPVPSKLDNKPQPPKEDNLTPTSQLLSDPAEWTRRLNHPPSPTLQPEKRAHALVELARMARWSGRYDAAIAHAQQALMAIESANSPLEPYIFELARCYQANLDIAKAQEQYDRLVLSTTDYWKYAGHIGLAEMDLDEQRDKSARKHLDGIPGIDSEELFGADALNPRRLAVLAQIHLLDGEMELAWSTMKDLIKSVRDQFEEHPLPLAPFLYKGGLIALVMGDVATARELLGEALLIQESAFPTGHPFTAEIINQLALATMTTGDMDEAERLFKRAIAMLEATLFEKHPALSSPLNNLGELYRVQEEYEVASELLARAVEIDQEAFGNKHPRAAASLSNLAFLLESVGDLEQAEALHQAVLEIQEKAHGPEHPTVAAALNNLAGLYLTVEEGEEARKLYQRAVTILEKSAGENHISTATASLGLAQACQAMKDYDTARKLFSRSLKTYVDAFGEKSTQVGATLLTWAQMEEEAGNTEKAQELLNQATSILENLQR